MTAHEVQKCCKNEEALHQRDIPEDLITHHILTKLPIKSLLRFKSVSKLWYSIISSHKIANTHFKLSPFAHPNSPTQCIFIHSGLFYNLFYYHDDDDNDENIDAFYGRKGLVRLGVNFDILGDEFRLVGSCNGLVCLASLSGYFIIWNPITRQWRKIAAPSSLKSIGKSKFKAWGFGYSSFLDDYKVVQMTKMHGSLNFLLHVFSLRSSEWIYCNSEDDGDDKGYVDVDIDVDVDDDVICVSERGVLVDEILYWEVAIIGEPEGRFFGIDLALGNGNFVDFNDPMLRSTYACNPHCLCVMGLAKFEELPDNVSITMLKRPGHEESIRLSRDLKLGICRNLVGFTRRGKFFILHGLGELGLVDPSSQPMKYTKLSTFEGKGGVCMVNHVPSLISPLKIAEWHKK